MAHDAAGSGRPSEPVERVEQLRDRIDRGEAADKVAVFDPAAVPLGADEEAAGTPPPPGALRLAAAAEDRRALDRSGALRNSAERFYPGEPASRWPLLLAGAMTLAYVGLLVWLFA